MVMIFMIMIMIFAPYGHKLSTGDIMKAEQFCQSSDIYSYDTYMRDSVECMDGSTEYIINIVLKNIDD